MIVSYKGDLFLYIKLAYALIFKNKHLAFTLVESFIIPMPSFDINIPGQYTHIFLLILTYST